jgi:hypothetical protein
MSPRELIEKQKPESIEVVATHGRELDGRKRCQYSLGALDEQVADVQSAALRARLNGYVRLADSISADGAR